MKHNTERPWYLVVLVAVAAIALLFVNGNSSPVAEAEAGLKGSEAADIVVVPIQVGQDAYGIAMVDKVGKTLWVYEISNRGSGHNRLRLLAARSWQYDQKLTEYNTGEPKPQQVRDILEKLTQQQAEQEPELEQEASPYN